jgi:hypothetical protein
MLKCYTNYENILKKSLQDFNIMGCIIYMLLMNLTTDNNNKKNAIKDSYAMTQSIMRSCTVNCREKNSITPIIVYLNNPFQDSTNA